MREKLARPQVEHAVRASEEFVMGVPKFLGDLGAVECLRQDQRLRGVPVQLKVEFWAKEKGKSCRRNNQEQDNEARAAKLERRGKDPGAAPAFD